MRNSKHKNALRIGCTLLLVAIVLPVILCVQSCEELKRLEWTKRTYEKELDTVLAAKSSAEAAIKVLQQTQCEMELQNSNVRKEIEDLLATKAEIQNEIHIINETKLAYIEDKSLIESEILQLNKEKEQLTDELQRLREEISSMANRTDTPDMINSLVQKDGDVKDEHLALVSNELSLLPQSVLRLFEEHNVVVYVTTKNIAKDLLNGAYSSVQGVTLYGQNTIYIEDRQKACTESTLHECGHLFNKYNGWAMSTVEWQTIYAEESAAFGKLAGTYCISNLDECFAEAFAFYFKNGKTLQAHCPKMYAHIQNLIERME